MVKNLFKQKITNGHPSYKLTSIGVESFGIFNVNGFSPDILFGFFLSFLLRVQVVSFSGVVTTVTSGSAGVIEFLRNLLV